MASLKSDKTAVSVTASGKSATVREPSAARRRLPVIEETLEVDKVEVDKGGYRIAKRIDTREQLIDELLQNHRVDIERRPVGLQLAGTDIPQPRYEGDTLIVPVLEEILVTEKRLVLVEEVRITRVRGTHRKPETVTLRKEEIVVERLAAEDSSKASSS
jgi:uncharacterized protein (TIGR02271 family)